MLKEKIGQMLLIGFKGTDLSPEASIVKAIQERKIGGVILFASNIQNPSQAKQLTQELRHHAKEASLDPFFIGIDYEGGTVDRLDQKPGFMPTLSAAEIGQLSYEQAMQSAEQMADTLNQLNINLNFAPVVDVNVNPENPIIGKRGRSFSNDPKKVAEYAAIFSRAYQQRGIISTFKHFPGHGSSTGDTHLGFVDVTNTWQEEELEPYIQLLPQADRFSMVMTAHVVHSGLGPDGYPASLSAKMNQGILRNKLNFKGVVVTDDLQMRAITDNYKLADAVVLAANAGADLLIFGNQLSESPQDPEEIIDIIYKAVMAGRIPESRIEEAYRRIIALK
jgi:beta-N-acetylhexosaminidase